MRTLLKRYHRNWKRTRANKVYEQQAPYLDGFARMYHVHIRKSAGTSVNSAFWGLAGYSLKQVKREPILVKDKYVFVRNNKPFIEDGRYFYGNSHMPIWDLKLPADTFTFCMLRDPYKRLLSLYKYYLHIVALDPKTAYSQEPYYDTLIKQTKWLGQNFDEFLELLPRKHFSNQLFMFSETFDVHEAISTCNGLNRVYFQEAFNEAIEDLSKVVGISLEVKKERSFGKKVEVEITADQEQKAREMLTDEYLFFNAMCAQHKKS